MMFGILPGDHRAKTATKHLPFLVLIVSYDLQLPAPTEQTHAMLRCHHSNHGRRRKNTMKNEAAHSMH